MQPLCQKVWSLIRDMCEFVGSVALTLPLGTGVFALAEMAFSHSPNHPTQFRLGSFSVAPPARVNPNLNGNSASRTRDHTRFSFAQGLTTTLLQAVRSFCDVNRTTSCQGLRCQLESHKTKVGATVPKGVSPCGIFWKVRRIF